MVTIQCVPSTVRFTGWKQPNYEDAFIERTLLVKNQSENHVRALFSLPQGVGVLTLVPPAGSTRISASLDCLSFVLPAHQVTKLVLQLSIPGSEKERYHNIKDLVLIRAENKTISVNIEATAQAGGSADDEEEGYAWPDPQRLEWARSVFDSVAASHDRFARSEAAQMRGEPDSSDEEDEDELEAGGQGTPGTSQEVEDDTQHHSHMLGAASGPRVQVRGGAETMMWGGNKTVRFKDQQEGDEDDGNGASGTSSRPPRGSALREGSRSVASSTSSTGHSNTTAAGLTFEINGKLYDARGVEVVKEEEPQDPAAAAPLHPPSSSSQDALRQAALAAAAAELGLTASALRTCTEDGLIIIQHSCKLFPQGCKRKSSSVNDSNSKRLSRCLKHFWAHASDCTSDSCSFSLALVFLDSCAIGNRSLTSVGRLIIFVLLLLGTLVFLGPEGGSTLCFPLWRPCRPVYSAPWSIAIVTEGYADEEEVVVCVIVVGFAFSGGSLDCHCTSRWTIEESLLDLEHLIKGLVRHFDKGNVWKC